MSQVQRRWVGVCLQVAVVGLLAPAVFAQGSPFVRGDTDGDARINITDAIRILGFLFQGSPADIACRDAADADDSGTVNITDGIYLLQFLFSGGRAPKAPYPVCGTDPTSDALACTSHPACPCTPDSLPPIITSVRPPDGAQVSDPRPLISATYTDNCGVDPSTVRLFVDGAEVTPQLVTPDRLEYTPQVDLAEEEHSLFVSVADRAGNGTTSGPSQFTIIPPSDTPPGFIHGSVLNAATLEPLVGAVVSLSSVRPF